MDEPPSSTRVPDLYWADVLIWDPKRNQKMVAKLPFLLPHEWLGDYLLQDGAFEEGLPQASSWQAQALKEVCNAWGEPEEGMFPIGMHGHGVSVQGRMNQSTFDYFTMLSNLAARMAFGHLHRNQVGTWL